MACRSKASLHYSPALLPKRKLAHPATVFHPDGLLPAGSRGDHRDLHSYLFRNKAQVRLSVWRKLRVILQPERGLLPARKNLIPHRHAFEHFSLRRKTGKQAAFVFILDAHRNFGEMIQNIELSDNQGRQMVKPGAVARGGRVKPAAAARPSRDSAIFAPPLAEFSAFFPVKFSRKRPTADARGIRLGNAQRRPNTRGANAGSGARSARSGA